MKWASYSVLILLSIIVGGQALYYTFFVDTVVIGNMSTTSVLSNKVIYSGYILTIIIALAFLLNGVYWKLLLLVYLACTLLGIIDFTAWTFSLGIGDLEIRLLPLSLIILHLFLNQDLFSFLGRSEDFSNKLMLPSNNDPAQPEQIAFFEKKFESKSNEALLRIIELNELVPEAIAAANNLLEKRK